MKHSIILQAIPACLVLRRNDDYREVTFDDHHLRVVRTEAHFIIRGTKHRIDTCRLLRRLEVSIETGVLDESLATQSDELAQELLACGVRADSNISRSRKGEQVLQDISQLKGVRQNNLHRNVLWIVYFRFWFHAINQNGRTEFPNCVRPTNG